MHDPDMRRAKSVDYIGSRYIKNILKVIPNHNFEIILEVMLLMVVDIKIHTESRCRSILKSQARHFNVNYE